jgi:hypothetical protein
MCIRLNLPKHMLSFLTYPVFMKFTQFVCLNFLKAVFLYANVIENHYNYTLSRPMYLPKTFFQRRHFFVIGSSNSSCANENYIASQHGANVKRVDNDSLKIRLFYCAVICLNINQNI